MTIKRSEKKIPFFFNLLNYYKKKNKAVGCNQVEGIPLLGGYGGTAEGLWSAYFTIKGEVLVQIPTQKNGLSP